MTLPFVGEIRPFAFDFPPRLWARCDGQLLAIINNQTLFSLIGARYGGDGVQTFALPDLRGRTGIGWGQQPGWLNYGLGAVGGEEGHVLTQAEIPSHTHPLLASDNPATPSNANTLGTGKSLARAQATGNLPLNLYGTGSANGVLALGAVAAKSGAAHENRQPYAVMTFCIAIQGLYPSRN